MKPNFALDLSHDGISLLHRGKGGWTLVGEVELDDPDMGGRLNELRRMAAELESGGLTTKLIIPNSQILYTTLAAPGPDDIAREVQIRAGLDGLTPYAVGDLVFDWRAEGEQARVAVLARETMDEAEAFAGEYRFNPVSFVARPTNGEFSGEPFFGKTRAASRIIPASERVLPDASPVPRRPRAMELTAEARIDTPPAAEPTPAPEPAPAVDPLELAEDTAYDTSDPFATFDEANGLDDPAPEADDDTLEEEIRSRRKRKGRDAASQLDAPMLAPFPPTSDDEGAAVAPPPKKAKTRKRRKPKVKPPAPPRAQPPVLDPAAETVLPPAAQTEPLDTPVPAGPLTLGAGDLEPRDGPSGPSPIDPAPIPSTPDVPKAAEAVDTVSDVPKPDPASTSGLPFSSRRTGGDESSDSSPAKRVATMLPRIGIATGFGGAVATAPVPKPSATPAPSGSAPTLDPAQRGAYVPPPTGAPVDRIRAEMAAALSKPLPKPGEPGAEKTKKDGPSPLVTVGTATRGTVGKLAGMTGAGLRSTTSLARDGMAARSEKRAARKSEKAAAAAKALEVEAPTSPAATPTPKAKKPSGKKPAKIETEDPKEKDAEALTVFGARKPQDTRGKPKYLGLILTLVLLLLMAMFAVWSSFFVNDGEVSLFNPGPEVAVTTDATLPPARDDTPAAATPDAPVTPEPTDPAPLPEPEQPIGEVLSPEAAEARYAATGIWQRAPEILPDPETTRLEDLQIAAIGAIEPAREVAALPGATASIPEALPADPLAPPPPGTTFDLDASGLVRPTSEGAISPTGILVYAGRPALVPPVRPAALAPADLPAAPDIPEANPEVPALPQAPGVPRVRPLARPAGLVPDNAALETPEPDTRLTAARPAPRPGNLEGAEPAQPVIAAAAAIDAAVEDAIESAFAGASELAVATSRKPTHRPSNFARIVETARARASDGSTVAAAAPTPASATVAPSIPTRASVATRATMENAINLRAVNLIGIYGTSNSRRALVRMGNGRYVKVKVGDRLDGGTVTSISSSRLTYQKRSKTYALDVLPLG